MRLVQIWTKVVQLVLGYGMRLPRKRVGGPIFAAGVRMLDGVDAHQLQLLAMRWLEVRMPATTP